MSELSPDRDAQFSGYVGKVIEWLFPDSPPEDLLLKVQQQTRPNSLAAKHGYPLGLAKTYWRRREQLTNVFSFRATQLSKSERIDYVLKHEAFVRALDAERLLGSFHWAGDSFPVEMLDQTAANMLHWIHFLGYDLVPIEPIPDNEFPDVPMPNPLVFDPNTLTVVRGRAPSHRVVTPPPSKPDRRKIVWSMATGEKMYYDEDDDPYGAKEREREIARRKAEGWQLCCVCHTPLENTSWGDCPDCGTTWWNLDLQSPD